MNAGWVKQNEDKEYIFSPSGDYGNSAGYPYRHAGMLGDGRLKVEGCLPRGRLCK